jgi:polyketide synthase PksN
MTEYGFDSRSFGEISAILYKKYNFVISPAKFFEYPSIEAFSQQIYQENYNTILPFYQKSKNSFHSLNRSECISLTGHEKKIKNQSTKKSYSKKITTGRLKTEPIAIIGMSGILPGADNIEAFWENLVTGKNLVTAVPEKRFKWGGFRKVLLRENESDSLFDGGFIKDIDKFDAAFFNISPHEAELMDPQQRIFMEIVWKTIEDAGYRISELSGSNTGLFVGVSSSDYADIIGKNPKKIESHFATGLSHSVLANRISYCFNFHGPSEPIDTACSSSLIAVHRAFQEIQVGNCDMAIAGGVNVLLNPEVFISFKKSGMLSDDGQCKAFDECANGYVRGEGAGAVLLKPLKHATNDGNHIYGVITASGVNHGGRASSLTAPNMIAQSNLLIDIYERANCDPATISYIEAHGTGTSLGDPIEVDGLKRAFSALSKKSRPLVENQKHCGIGSVKTNIGHLEAAAGIAGLLKVLLSLKYKKIPPNINFKRINPYIDLNESPFYIVTDTQDWVELKDREKNTIPRRAGISSFGFGGSNAHLLIEEYEIDKSLYNPNLLNPQIFLFSAKNEKSLAVYIHQMLEFLAKAKKAAKVNCCEKSISQSTAETTMIKFNEIAYTLQVGRESFNKRLAIIASNMDELIDHLRKYLQQSMTNENIYYGNAMENNPVADLLIEENEGKELLKRIMHRKQLTKLTKLWVSGIVMDWSLLYNGQPPRRISMPTYAFHRTSHWYNTNNLNQNSYTVDNNACQHKEIESDAIDDTLASLEPKSKKEFLISYLTKTISHLLKIRPEQQISSKMALVSIGLDSLMALKLKEHIDTSMRIDTAAIQLLGDASIESIANQILNHLDHSKLPRFTEDRLSYPECQKNNLIEGVI